MWNFIYWFSAIYVYGLYLSSVHFYDTGVFSGIHIINTTPICHYSNQDTLARSFGLFWWWGKGFQSSLTLFSIFLAFLKISLILLYYFYLPTRLQRSTFQPFAFCTAPPAPAQQKLCILKTAYLNQVCPCNCSSPCTLGLCL